MPGRVALTERDAELGILMSALAAARSGSGSAVQIIGPIGIGKSALLDVFSSLCSAHDVHIMRARAVPMERNFGFGVTRQLLESTLTGAPPEVRDGWLRGNAGHALLALFGDAGAVGDDGSPALLQELLNGLDSLIEQMGAGRPVVMLVDDLQWADVSSLAWLDYLSRRVHRMRVLAVCTTTGPRRLDLAAPSRCGLLSHAATLELPPLSLVGTRALVGHYRGRVGDDLALAFHDGTGGNPLYLTSMLSALATGKSMLKATDDPRDIHPAELRDRIMAHVRAQSEHARACVMAIAILGDRADEETVGTLAKLDDVEQTETLRALKEVGLLAAQSVLRFTHPVVREAVELSMTALEREQAHRAAALLLHGVGGDSEDVAHHLLAGSSAREPWTDAVLRAASQRAVARGAPRAAARYLRRALLDCGPDGPQRGGLLVDLALAERGFDPPASVQHLSQGLPLLGDAVRRAAALVQIAPTVVGSELLPAVDLLAEAAAEVASSQGESTAERRLALRVEARLRYANMPDPTAVASAVKRLAQLGRDPSMDTAAQRELIAVLLHTASGGVRIPAADAAVLGNRLLSNENAEPAHVHTVLPLVAHTLFAADALDAIDPWLATCYDRAVHRDAPVELALIRAEQALIALGRGAVGLARRWAHEANGLADLDWEQTNEICTAALAAVAIETRDGGLARRLVARHHRDRTDNFGLALLLRMLGGATATAAGDLDGALVHLAECGRQLESIGWRNVALYPWRTWTASIHFRRGDRSMALRYADEAYADAQAWGASAVLGRALRLRGHFTDGAAGIRLLEDAVSVLEPSANRLERGKAMMALGQRLAAAGAPGGYDIGRRGLGIARACGAWWLNDAGPVAAGPAGESGLDPPALTGAERRVAALVVRGHTNQEIATQLGVTSRAVEKHLTNSYRKLGVPGRGGLIDMLKESR